MRTRNADHYVIPDDNLVWLYHWSAADQDPSSAASLRIDQECAAMVPGWVSHVAPPERCQRAAGKARMLRRSLSRLHPELQSVLEACYAHRFAPAVKADQGEQRTLTPEAHGPHAAAWAEYQALAKDWGIAAGAILQARRRGERRAAEVAKHVAWAHDHWRLHHGEHCRELHDERMRMRERRQARSEALLAELLGRPKKERLRLQAVAWLEAYGIEVEA